MKARKAQQSNWCSDVFYCEVFSLLSFQFNIIVTKCTLVACCISLWGSSFSLTLLFVNFRGVTNTGAFANAVLTIGCDDWLPNAGHRFSMVVEQIWVLFQFKYSKKQKTPQKRGFVYNDKKGTLGLLDQVNEVVSYSRSFLCFSTIGEVFGYKAVCQGLVNNFADQRAFFVQAKWHL